MKSASWVAVLLAVAMTGSAAVAADGSPPPRDKAAIEAVLAAQEKAWNAGDLDTFFQGYWQSDEVSYSGSDGVVKGWNRVLERFKKKYSSRQLMGTLKFSNLETRSLGPDAALMLGQFHLRRDSGNVGGVFSLVFQRFPDGWKIIHDHTSGVASMAGASNSGG